MPQLGSSQREDSQRGRALRSRPLLGAAAQSAVKGGHGAQILRQADCPPVSLQSTKKPYTTGSQLLCLWEKPEERKQGFSTGEKKEVSHRGFTGVDQDSGFSQMKAQDPSRSEVRGL